MTDQPGCPCSICEEDYVNRSDSRGSAGQSADLRDCVADTIWEALKKQNNVVNFHALADAVIAQLEADYVLVPKGHTIARIRSAEKLGLTGDGA